MNIEDYPKEGQHKEEITYKDQNDFDWKIVRVENGFIVAYFGDEYFSNTQFACEVENGKYIHIKNTRCFFIRSTEFEVFAEFRNILQEGYTDDIWDCIEEFFTERLQNDLTILETEVV